MKTTLLVVLLALGACKKSEDKPWLPDPTALAPMTETEVKRGKEACDQYFEKVCACAATNPTRKDIGEACKLARGYPEALQVGLDVALDTASEKRDVKQTQDVARKTMKKCFEEVARLPLLGC